MAESKTLKITNAGTVAAELLFYQIKPELEHEFFGDPKAKNGFYFKTILPWLRIWGGERADPWIVRQKDKEGKTIGLHLVVVSSPEPSEWDPIEGLQEFLVGTARVSDRPDLNHPQPQ